MCVCVCVCVCVCLFVCSFYNSYIDINNLEEGSLPKRRVKVAGLWP